jgi:hypothetical protein
VPPRNIINLIFHCDPNHRPHVHPTFSRGGLLGARLPLGSVMSGVQPLRAPRSCRGALLLRVGQAPDSVLVFFTPRAFGNAAGALHLSHAPPGPPEHRRDLQWPRASEDDLRHVDRANPDPHAAGMRPLQACKPKTGSRQTRTTVTLLRSASTSHTTSALNKRWSREGLGPVSASYFFF